MVTVTSVLRRSSTVTFLTNGGSSGESSRRPSVAADAQPSSSRRPSLAGLSLRLSARGKRSHSTMEADTCARVDARKLGEAFFSLPDDIIIPVLCYLSQPDIFALRLTSRSTHSLLESYASPITRSLLLQCAYDHPSGAEKEVIAREKAEHTYDYIRKLYPQPLPCTSMAYLLQMLRRQSQIDKMLSTTVGFVQMKIYMIPGCPRFDDFRPYKMRIMRRMHLAAWTICHFLERYGEMLVFEHPRHSGPSSDVSPSSESHEEQGPRSQKACPACMEHIKSILRTYPRTEIISAYHFYDLCQQHLRALSRAPSYTGTLERRLKGRRRQAPTDAQLAQYVILGGIPELCKLSMLKGSYYERIGIIGSFVEGISSAVTSNHSAAERCTAASETGIHTPPSDDVTISQASFSDLVKPLLPPFATLTQDTISAVPDLGGFVTDSEEWLTRMFELVRPEDQIVSAFGFVQNILAGKAEPRVPGEGEAETNGTTLEDGDLDYLAPVKGFD